MSRANVAASGGWVPVSNALKTETLSGSLPLTSTKFCFAESSVGLGGRFMAYAVDGSQKDLHAFAKAEFAAHWDKPAWILTRNVESPFDADYIAFWEQSYGVELDWLRDAIGASGSVYVDAAEQGSHVPHIFIDETNGILYFVMTD
ncbi:MAG: hypothetical protein KDB27_34605 [Planctomycetales bacterium]|nr:hypothetical protein [Planctomycetales bacterium]